MSNRTHVTAKVDIDLRREVLTSGGADTPIGDHYNGRQTP